VGYKSIKFRALRRLQPPLNNSTALKQGKSPNLGAGAVTLFPVRASQLHGSTLHARGNGKKLSCRASFIYGYNNITIIHHVTTELAQTTSVNRWQKNVPAQAHRQD
jgi:hypothetical protein